MHTFMTELPQLWLQPARENLTSLALHMDDFWGYVPKVDFRSLHFPKLKKLELGNYTFSHDWQLEWILSHQALEELILDDCPIVRHARNFGPIDQEGYLVTPTVSSGPTTISRYDGRWAEYFRRLEGMPKLKKLKFGVGEWRDGRNFDGAEWVQDGVHGNMYMRFDRGMGPTPWSTWKGAADEDAAAYGSLMATLAKR